MEYKSSEMIQILNQIIKVLKISDGPTAKYFCEFLIYTLDQLHKPHELHKIAENILKIYGGMGSFSDVLIFSKGECLRKECDELNALRTKLFKQCEAAIEEARK